MRFGDWAIGMFGKNRFSRWLVGAVILTAVDCAGLAAIEAALNGSPLSARKALLIHPAIGEWEPTAALLQDLVHPLCAHC